MRDVGIPAVPGVPSWRRLVLAALAIAMLAPIAKADAATVTTTEDGGAGSLRQAIGDATAGEIITVPAGDYTLTKGELTISKSLTLAGAGSAVTIISGAKSSRVFSIKGESTEVTISGLTVTEGRVTEQFAEGAAIRSIGANLSLRGDVITGNVASAPEGGIVFGGALLVKGGNLTVADTNVVGNLAEASGGGGQPGGFISGGGVLAVVQALAIERSTIANNRAHARGGSDPLATRQDGGSIFGAGMAANAAQSVLIDSTISGNVGDASNGPGGEGGFSQGGGISLVGGIKSRISQITVSGNIARAGQDGTVLGGGMRLASDRPIEIASSTVAGNSGGQSSNTLGGNVFVELGQVRFSDSIVAGGVGPTGSENCGSLEGGGSIVSEGFNLESGNDCGFGTAGDIVNTDPLLGALGNNGGPTQTMLPAANSAVIDQGAAFGLRGDQRGAPRVVDNPSIPNSAALGADGSDIGAVEAQPSR